MRPCAAATCLIPSFRYMTCLFRLEDERSNGHAYCGQQLPFGAKRLETDVSVTSFAVFAPQTAKRCTAGPRLGNTPLSCANAPPYLRQRVAPASYEIQVAGGSKLAPGASSADDH